MQGAQIEVWRVGPTFRADRRLFVQERLYVQSPVKAMSIPAIQEIRRNFYTLSQAAKALGVSRVTLWKRIKAGKIAADRIGREVLVEKSGHRHAAMRRIPVRKPSAGTVPAPSRLGDD